VRRQPLNCRQFVGTIFGLQNTFDRSDVQPRKFGWLDFPPKALHTGLPDRVRYGRTGHHSVRDARALPLVLPSRRSPCSEDEKHLILAAVYRFSSTLSTRVYTVSSSGITPTLFQCLAPALVPISWYRKSWQIAYMRFAGYQSSMKDNGWSDWGDPDPLDPGPAPHDQVPIHWWEGHFPV